MAPGAMVGCRGEQARRRGIGTRHRGWLLALVLAALLGGCGGSGASPPQIQVTTHRTAKLPPSQVPPPTLRAENRGLRGKLRRVKFFSAALGRPDSYLVYLPPGYEAAVRRGVLFPALYLLHGDGAGTRHLAINMFKHGHIGKKYDRLIGRGRIRPFLIVMPEGGDGTFNDDTEWANTADGAFESYVLDVVAHVDSSWATIPSRTARGIAGLSMGGYAAVNIALHHLDVFAVLESWSGYFTATPTGVFARSPAEVRQRNSPAIYAHQLSHGAGQLGLHALLYSAVSDPLIGQQAPFASELRALGAGVTTAAFRGIPHDFRLWGKKMPLALEFASRWLQAAA